MNNIEKQYVIKRENLNEEHYFQSILLQAEKMKLLTDTELESIKLQSIQLLAKQTERFTGGSSSSVTVETAQSITMYIFYCIGIFLKGLPEIDMGIVKLKQEPLCELYQNGRQIIESQISCAKELLEAVQRSRVHTSNQAYNDTIEEGIASFFSCYDADFTAHYTQASIDYPLSNGKMNLAGIEYIYSYLYKLLLENQFCQNFSSQSINSVLHSYNNNYESLLVNIFQLVLINALGCILVKKSALKLNIESKDLQYLQQELEALSKEELYMILQGASEQLFIQLDILSKELQEYILLTLQDASVSLKNALENNQLKAVFVILEENARKQSLQFQDGLKMEDELFRKIAEEIGQCRFVSDKIEIIKKDIHSIVDLVDIFQGTCIFQEEFNKVFDSLGDMELALLLKMIPLSQDDFQLDHIESEEEWQCKLASYLKGLDSVRSGRIIELSNTVNEIS